MTTYPQELSLWRNGRTQPGDFIATSMANFMTTNGQMNKGDAARIAAGGLTETDQDRMFSAASYGRPLRPLRPGPVTPYAQRAAALGAWAAGMAKNQPIDTSRADWLDESLSGPQHSLRQSNLSESSLGGGL